MASRKPGGNYLKLVDARGATDDSPDVYTEVDPHGFPESHVAPWLRACRRLDQAGYGRAVAEDYVSSSRQVAALVGPDSAIDLADAVSIVAIRSGLPVSRSLMRTAVLVAGRVQTPQLFLSWLNLMQRFATMAPESVSAVLSGTGRLLGELGVAGLEGWLLAGIRSGGGDRDRRLAFFTLKDPEAERLIHRKAGDVSFHQVERRVKLFTAGLFGLRVNMVEAPAHLPDAQRRRSGFHAGVVRMPSSYPGYRGPLAETVFRAAVAHVGAHLTYSTARFEVGRLKPVQVALVSLIEDARVEALALGDFPGLLRVWLPFHVAQATGVMTAPSLFARLARALIDPDYSDMDGWVNKGRALFDAHRDRLHDPSISRHIGNLLGNDLGQMRVQFNARDHVVEPPYRDDNLGLWRFDEDLMEETEIEMATDAYRLRDNEQDEDSRRDSADAPRQEAGRASSVEEPSENQGWPICRYPEFDHILGAEREAWVQIVGYETPAGDPARLSDVRARREVEAKQISALVRSATVSRGRRMKRQPDGETLDMDACIGAMADLQRGEMPDARVYQTMQHRERDMSVHILLDISQSTADRLPARPDTILDMQCEASYLLGNAMAELGDPFAISAFQTNGREDVRIFALKSFAEPFDTTVQARLFGMTPGLSTRMGAVLRHGGAVLSRQATYRRLLILITDGEPSDIDCPDPDYLVQDARRAVQTLGHSGIDLFCIGLGDENGPVLERVFGRRNVVRIDKISKLPEKLPLLYLRLTR